MDLLWLSSRIALAGRELLRIGWPFVSDKTPIRKPAVLIIGAPGAGKGTQGTILSRMMPLPVYVEMAKLKV
jgi:hypothetical protein